MDHIATEGSRSVLGSKGFNLYRCSLLGVDVPDYRILTTGCYRDLAEKGIDDDLGQSLDTILWNLEGHVAVRSSSPEEDLHGSSSAGMFESVLGVRTSHDLHEAVRTVWDSSGGREIAVIIQRMVIPEISGVLFTRDPLSGIDEIIVEYVEGRCDKLVSGRVVPERLILKNGENGKEPDFTSLINTSRFMESRSGYPLDIEWSLEKGSFRILQARPITAIPVPDKRLGRTYSRVLAEQFYSGPVSILFFSIFRKVYTRYYLNDTMKELGLDIEIGEDRMVSFMNHIYMDTCLMERFLPMLLKNDEGNELWDLLPSDMKNDLIEKKNSPFFLIIKLAEYYLLHPDIRIGKLDRHFRQRVVPEILRRLHDMGDYHCMSDE